MAEWVRFTLCAVLAAAGIFVIFVSILGVFRFKFVLNRMHCAAIIDTLGALFLLAALMLAAKAPAYLWKLLFLVLFLWIGTPIASHLVARLELRTDETALAHMEHPDETEENADGIL